MRTLCWWSVVGVATMALMGCSSSTPVNPEGASLPASNVKGYVDPSGLMAANAGEFQINVNLKTGKSTITPIVARNGNAIGDLYFLKVNQFGLEISEVTVANYDVVNNTVDLGYQVAHSFAAPANPAGPATAANRADLGVSGRVCFLQDAPSGRVADNTSALNTGDYEFTFGTATEVMNAKAILNADGYYDPAGMLSTTPANGTTAYPFKTLVNDGVADSRTHTTDNTALARGADSTGNYATTTNWSASSAVTASHIGYTGYGVLHQGTKAKNSITVNVAPGAEEVTLTTAIIANYTDPRGGANAAEKRANRLPTNDPTKYAYRMPHGAVDMEQITVGNATGTLGAAAASTQAWDVSIVDQDASTTVGAGLGEIPNASGVASIEAASAELGAQPVFAASTGTGPWEDPLVYAGYLVTNTAGTAGGIDTGAYLCVKVVDEQDAAAAGFDQGFTLNNASPPVPVAAGSEQHPIVFQVAFIDIT
ncbi:MAG: hypothetical protein ABI743_12205 [bacterium]